MKQKFNITGMSCSACSSHIEKAVGKLAGITKISVNLLTNSMQAEYDENLLDADSIIETVEKAGYGASLVMENTLHMTGYGDRDTETIKAGQEKTGGRQNTGRMAAADAAEKEAGKMKTRLTVSVVFWIPLMYVAMYHMFYEWFGLPVPGIIHRYFHGPENAVTFAFTQLLLTLPIIYVNQKYFINGFKTLWKRSPNMDSLIALGAAAAVVYGVFAIYRIGYGLGHGDMALVEQYSMDIYFESAGTILTLITVGKYLEAKSKGKTSEAITRLLDLSPKTAVVIREEKEIEIPTEQVQAGDVFVIKPGGLIPVDGTVLSGESSVDEAAITGESIPVYKQKGDKVVSATVNKNGFLTCLADKVGSDTTLSQIIRLVEEAGASKAPIAKLADKIAGVFVPVVICIALAAGLFWFVSGAGFEFAMSVAIAVLVISCPCALGLATPVAIMVGTGVGAKCGILVKSGEALQEARSIDTVVLDKTGTITEGRPKVTDVIIWDKEKTEAEILLTARAVEQKSEHPLAEAIVEAAARYTGKAGGEDGRPGQSAFPSFEAEQFEAVPGKGVQAYVKGWEKTVYAGNEGFLSLKGVMLSEEQKMQSKDLAKEGKTPLFLAEDNRLWAIIGVADTVKPDSFQAIQELKKMGIETIMLTGDNEVTAKAIQKKLGIPQVIAQVLPEEKEKHIARLKEQGRKVAMVGDGINDAPALVRADVGIAIGAGTDVAIESADVVLMKSSLMDVPETIRLSRKVIRNIKQNLFWAFFYNCIGIPIAAGLFYPLFGWKLNPMFGSAAMSLSSIFVVTNALRLRNFKYRSQAAKREEKGEQKKMEKTMQIEGMMCEHCAGRVTKALEEIAGVTKVTVNLEDKSALVETAQEVSEDTLKKAVTEAGYEVTGIR